MAPSPDPHLYPTAVIPLVRICPVPELLHSHPSRESCFQWGFLLALLDGRVPHLLERI